MTKPRHHHGDRGFCVLHPWGSASAGANEWPPATGQQRGAKGGSSRRPTLRRQALRVLHNTLQLVVPVLTGKIWNMDNHLHPVLLPLRRNAIGERVGGRLPAEERIIIAED